MKIRDIVRLPEERGFVLDRRKGSHRQYEGFVNDKRRIVTVERVKKSGNPTNSSLFPRKSV